MTPRERVLIALKREGTPDRVPFEISWGAFTPSLMQVYKEQTGSNEAPDEYFDFDVRWVVLSPTKVKRDLSKYYKDSVDEKAFFDDWGVGYITGAFQHFMEIKYHPLANCKTAQEVLSYEWPDMNADYRYEGMEGKIKDYKDRGYAVAGDMYCTIFETAWMLRGMEDLLVDFYNNEDIVHAICDGIGEIRVKQAVRYARLGVDIIRLGDDVTTQRGPMFSPELYRRFIKEPTRKIIKAAKEVNPDILIFMHCDGKVEDIVEEFIDIGVDILNPVQPECNDLEKIMKLYGGRISFWGGIGTQSVMPFGTPQEVRDSVEDTKNILGKDGGLLLAPTHILEPDVPWENVMAFVDAVKNNSY
jgi:uroporphyrinogen decarboxylase